MPLNTAKIKADITARFTEKDRVQIEEVHSYTEDLVLEDFQNPKTWKRTKKFKRSNGQVVRYFMVKVPDFDHLVEPVCKIVSDPGDTEILECKFGAVREMSDFYFAFVDSYDERAVTVTPKDYWDAEGYVDDQSYANWYIPEDQFGELMESLYEYVGTEEQARQILLALGFTENPAMGHFGN